MTVKEAVALLDRRRKECAVAKLERARWARNVRAAEKLLHQAHTEVFKAATQQHKAKS